MLYEEEGKSLSEIARVTGLNYRTVRRYAYKEDWNAEESLRVENSPVLGDCAATIDRWLEEDRKVPRKQRHTARRIYDRLVEECGYRGSYSSVRRYVHRKKKLLGSVTEGFLPLDAPQGCAQADFGEFLYYDGAKKEKKGRVPKRAKKVRHDSSKCGILVMAESQCTQKGARHVLPSLSYQLCKLV